MLENIKWLGHASFKIKFEGTVIYIDPWNVSDKEQADIILITHAHYDHCSPRDVKNLSKNDTTVITTPDCAVKLKGGIKTVTPGESLTIKGIDITAVPAYNLDKPFHPKANQWLGFVINIKGTKIYHAGDTDLIPEMSKIKADIALLPVGGTYTMNTEEAAKAVSAINPQTAIPMHYGSVAGRDSDGQRFRKLADAKVKVLTRT